MLCDAGYYPVNGAYGSCSGAYASDSNGL